MKTIKIQLEYECYPVWLYDDEGFVEATALPPELENDCELNEKFKSIQKRFDETYVDTPTEFYNKGFTSPEEESALKADLKEAVDDLKKKCSGIYLVEVAPDLIA